MDESKRYWLLALVFGALGLLSLTLALTEQRVILGTGVCLALSVMMAMRARQSRR